MMNITEYLRFMVESFLGDCLLQMCGIFSITQKLNFFENICQKLN